MSYEMFLQEGPSEGGPKQRSRPGSKMEVDMIVFTSIEKISSPSTLAATIGIAPNSKLLFYRDHHEGSAQPACTKMVVRCAKSRASYLRRRFSNPRPYTHDGLLTSLKFVAMRPVVADASYIHQATLPDSCYDARLGGCSGTAQLSAWYDSSLPFSSSRRTSSAHPAGVQHALDLVENHEAAAGLSVPGIAELWAEFLHCAMPLDGVGRQTARRKGEGKDGEEKLGERRTGGESELSFDESAEKHKGTSSSEEMEDYSPACPRHERGVGCGHMPRSIWRERPGQSQNRTERGHRNQTTLRWSRDIVSEHRLRWYRRRTFACIADVSSALIRISRVYSDAPRTIDRSAVISLLAELFANGDVFAANRPRDMETLDQLGVVRWYSLAQGQPPSHVLEALREPKSKKAVRSWARLLGRVTGLVRNIVDFGIFLQLYAAAAERDRAAAGAAVPMFTEKNGCSGRNNSRNHAVLPPAEENNDRSLDSKWCIGRGGNAAMGSRSPLLFDGSRSETGHHKWIYDQYLPESGQNPGPESSQSDDSIISHPHSLKWLFPVCDDGARRAFHRHVICGGAIHGMVPVEAAAAIIRDAGKTLPADCVWRWCSERWERDNGRNSCRRGVFNKGHLLCFEEFVEMCEGLKEHMINAIILSPEVGIK